ncbi:PKD domain-containing protein [Streptomyces sp. T1317-0309]|nr:PKD domain-containing protein [Streptomyces sp. T1317-0309]
MTTPPSAIDRLTVEADTSASTDAWAITNRKIDFGDGSAPVDEGTATTDTHTYAKPGTYTVRLTETDWAGNTASTTTSMTVPTVRYSTALSLTTNASSYAYGATATVTAHLGTTYSNRAVSIYAQPYGGTKTLVKTGKVDSHGNLVASYKVTRNTVFTTAFSGDLEYPPRRRPGPPTAMRGWRSHSRAITPAPTTAAPATASTTTPRRPSSTPRSRPTRPASA